MSFLRTSAAVLGLALSLAVPAHAASGGRPTVVEVSRCDDFGPGVQLCTESRVVTKTTQTPSGNTLVHVRSRITGRFTSPDCQQDEFQRTFEHRFTRGPRAQVVTTKDRLRIVGTCFDPDGLATDCVQTIAQHLSNGVVRFDRFEFVCEPAQR